MCGGGGGGEAGALSGVCSDRREARSQKEAEYWALVCLFTAGSYVTSVVMSPSVHYGISYQLSDVSIHCRIIISFFIFLVTLYLGSHISFVSTIISSAKLVGLPTSLLHSTISTGYQSAAGFSTK